jgi:hypothetical protein
LVLSDFCLFCLPSAKSNYIVKAQKHTNVTYMYKLGVSPAASPPPLCTLSPSPPLIDLNTARPSSKVARESK